MLRALSDGDAAALERFFGPEAMYQNMPLPPAYGREAVVATLAGLFTALSVDRIDTYYIAARDGFVFTERMDLLTARHNGRSFELPVAGVFQVVDGGIVARRDYFRPEGVRGGGRAATAWLNAGHARGVRPQPHPRRRRPTGRRYLTSRPASMGSGTPVISRASSDARKTRARLMSSGSAQDTGSACMPAEATSKSSRVGCSRSGRKIL